MPLEATMLIIDNSEYLRNGDDLPTRFVAQVNAVNIVFQTKIDSNAESTVGIMTMAESELLSFDCFYAIVLIKEINYEHSLEVLATHTKDLGQNYPRCHIATGKIGG